MLEEWFIARRGPDGNKRYGPVSLSQLGEMVTSGRVAADDLVWREGMANWVRTDQCGEVSSLLPPPPPPPPRPVPPPPSRRPEHRPEYHREPPPEPRRGDRRAPDERPFPPRRPPVKSSNGWVAVVAIGGVVLLVCLLVCGGGFVVSLMEMRKPYYGGTSSSSYYNPPQPVVDPGPDFFPPPPPLPVPPVADLGLGTRLEYNPSELYYTNVVPLDEAQRLGDYLDRKGSLPHDHRATVQVNHDFLGTVQVRFCVNPDAVNDQATIDVYRALRRDLVQDVYPLQTVEVHLCDGNMATLRTITFLDD